MAFFKKVLKKMGGKWHPQAVTVGKPVTTKEVADCLSQISTVSRADGSGRRFGRLYGTGTQREDRWSGYFLLHLYL